MSSSANIQNLFYAFDNFAAFGDRTAPPALDSAKFVKLCKDCSLLDKSFTVTQADLIFAKVKGKNERKLNFDQFLLALELIATAKYGMDTEVGIRHIHEQILYSKGPTVRSAAADAVDTSGIYAKLTNHHLYTGLHRERFDTYGRGRGLDGRDSPRHGNGTVPAHPKGGPVHDLSEITREHMRGGTYLSTGSPGSASIGRIATRMQSFRLDADESKHVMLDDKFIASTFSPSKVKSTADQSLPPNEELHQVFLAYCAFGGTTATVEEMDGVKFAKLCKEAKIIGRGLSYASVDVTFSKVRTRGQRTITFQQFLTALAMLALEKFPTIDTPAAQQQVIDMVLATGGPLYLKAAAQAQISRWTENTSSLQ